MTFLSYPQYSFCNIVLIKAYHVTFIMCVLYRKEQSVLSRISNIVFPVSNQETNVMALGGVGKSQKVACIPREASTRDGVLENV